eukprot:IDg9540t1
MKDESALALEKYLSLANSATSPEEAATLCLSATGDPALHVFAELLSAPNVASLVGTPYESSYELLRLFAFQTYAHYAENKSSYPPLSAAHERKLRRLSVITLAGRASTLSYDSLRRCLHVTTVREVEDAVLDAVYAGLLQARLDPRAQAVEVLAAAGRDAPPRTGVADMHVLLSRWAGTARGVVAAIDDTVAAMQSASKDKMLERNVANSAAAAARDTYSVDGAAGSRDRP